MSPSWYCYRCSKVIPISEKREHNRVSHARPQRGPERELSGRPWRTLRQQILNRDNYQCTYTTDGKRCLVTFPLEVHHANGDRNDNRPENLITLCVHHHGRMTSHG